MAPRVLCVVGPTASGKTKMAVALARRFGGEVVSVDSMQIYRGMTIGTAAPTAEEMEGVPHHMIAVADPAEQWSAARFCQAADACIQDILSRGRLPVLAGGTGLYLDALIRGDDFAPGSQGGEVRLRLQRELREQGPEALLERLRTVDPETAGRLHLRDEKRILRALEIYEQTGEPMSLRDRRGRQRPDRYEAVYIGLSFRDREDLRQRIDRRVDDMVRVQVMLTLKNGPELELAEDADDTDRDGELRRQREPVTLNRGSGYQDVVVTRETYPVYLGAVVVCLAAERTVLRRCGLQLD